MKFATSISIFGLLPLALAAQSYKSFLVTYPQNTPDSVINDAKKALINAGGVITHEYHLLKGFAAQATENTIQTISTLSTTYNPFIEEDQIVTVDGDLTDS
ncbi:hypothetical protein ASPZODRAFT_145292 [Penicilliopsis zonata CBS 506.65]|uniref:Inhibitor I9 domain-containing protein n=1 Tax=Penicilliopsis zonata CBS 506.65 TaxID=1073090 RepID=A0A1L9SAG3_9EURO|nr:hypothetical protein ASPZODRAFT_145292 [Penicilliopsis zonata CBS 506.65]OJJ44180.1 hypothetical protein ASPZODRAFT_145292 [Penicilliopsis zonata CBS 506.65]